VEIPKASGGTRKLGVPTLTDRFIQQALLQVLATLLEKRRMHLNLLTYNPTGPGLSGVAYEPPPRETVGVFLDELHARGIVAHFRRPRGATIDGACGQLRARAGG